MALDYPKPVPANPFVYPVFRPNLTDMCFCHSGELFGWCCASEEPDRRPPHGVHIVPRFLDSGTCKVWIAALSNRPRTASSLYDHERSTATRLKTKTGKGRTSEYIDVTPIRQALDQAVARAFGLAPKLFGREVEMFELPRVLRYAPGQHYGIHADNCHRERHQNFWTKMVDRDVSLLMYLNQDFTGGGLAFEKFRYVYQPSAGDLLMFPSDNRYKHGALPVESGIRYVAVSWGAYLDQPRLHQKHPGIVLPMSDFQFTNEDPS